MNHFKNHDIDLEKVMRFATMDSFRGGWEGWLQVEIADSFREAYDFEREIYYPGCGERADFRISDKVRERGTPPRQLYVELKCMTVTEKYHVWRRFSEDMNKVLRHTPVQCVALLATYGTFIKADIDGFRTQMRNMDNLWVLDYSNLQISTLSHVALDGEDRLFIVAMGNDANPF